MSCASLRSELWWFFCLSFLSQFAYSQSVTQHFCFMKLERSLFFFSSCGLFRDLYGNAVWGASVPLSGGFFGLAFSCSVGVPRLCFNARVTCFLVALCMWLRAAFPCLSTRSAPHVRQSVWQVLFLGTAHGRQSPVSGCCCIPGFGLIS